MVSILATVRLGKAERKQVEAHRKHLRKVQLNPIDMTWFESIIYSYHHPDGKGKDILNEDDPIRAILADGIGKLKPTKKEITFLRKWLFTGDWKYELLPIAFTKSPTLITAELAADLAQWLAEHPEALTPRHKPYAETIAALLQRPYQGIPGEHYKQILKHSGFYKLSETVIVALPGVDIINVLSSPGGVLDHNALKRAGNNNNGFRLVGADTGYDCWEPSAWEIDHYEWFLTYYWWVKLIKTEIQRAKVRLNLPDAPDEWIIATWFENPEVVNRFLDANTPVGWLQPGSEYSLVPADEDMVRSVLGEWYPWSH